MKRFASVRDAKEYLMDRILAQADRDHVPLSEIERKMLYFTETGWALPDMMEVSREFDENYEQDEYESKIGGIVRRMHDEPDHDREIWDDVVRCLRNEDHYLLVLIDAAARKPAKTSRGDRIRLTLSGVVVVAVFLPASFYVFSHVQNPSIAKWIWINAGGLVGLLLLAKFFANRGQRGSS